MKKLYPIKFTPIHKEKVWGNESWLISDIEDSATVASNGFLADNDLADIQETYFGELIGDELFEYFNLQFPLLIKIMEVKELLSVQVHPSDEIAMERYYSFGKNEMGYVLEAGPDARIYLGFKRDVTAGEFYEACKNGSVVDLMNEFIPKKGESFYVEAGTIHACGGGLKVLEIEQPSDITFRLFDWGRENDPSLRREMHLEEALDAINFKAFDFSNYHFAEETLRAECKDFIVKSIVLTEPHGCSPELFKSPVVYLCTEGQAVIEYKAEQYAFSKGEAILIPASLDDLIVSPVDGNAHLLEVVVPQRENDEDAYIKK